LILPTRHLKTSWRTKLPWCNDAAMPITLTTVLCVAAMLIALSLMLKVLRKATGLLLIILGIMACMTGIGLLVGVPLIFVGGILIFW
jgi:hypothetical protein